MIKSLRSWLVVLLIGPVQATDLITSKLTSTSGIQTVGPSSQFSQLFVPGSDTLNLVTQSGETLPTSLSAVETGLQPLNAVESNILDAYQEGTLGQIGVQAQIVENLERVADEAIRKKLASTDFRTRLSYGLLPTRIYESSDFPGIIIKTYSRRPGELFRSHGATWLRYHMAKEILGEYFADTSIVENLEIVIDGKPRKLSWALIQEDIRTAGISKWGDKARSLLEAMKRRGIKDTDLTQRGFRPEFVNMGETIDGRFVHFDADLFKPISNASESPKRVRDPPPLRNAIRRDQASYLRTLSRTNILTP